MVAHRGLGRTEAVEEPTAESYNPEKEANRRGCGLREIFLPPHWFDVGGKSQAPSVQLRIQQCMTTLPPEGAGGLQLAVKASD